MEMGTTQWDQFPDALAKAIGRDSYPESALEVLEARGHIDDYREGKISSEEFLTYARALAFYGDLVENAAAIPEGRDVEREVQPPQLGDYEEQRAGTLGAYLELRVAAHPDVLKWRKNTWSTTRPLPPEDAYAIVEDADRRDTLSGSRDIKNKETQPSGHLEFFTREPGRVEPIPYYSGSSLEDLHKVSKRLKAVLFPEWTHADAAWVIVTGEVREVPWCLVGDIEDFSNSYLTYTKVRLEVEPWITAETVTQAYQYLQRLVLGRRPRAFSEKNMTMARFVMSQLRNLLSDGSDDEGSQEISWRVMARLWNQTYPHWSYPDEWQFYQDVHRVIRAVARPYDAVGPTSENTGEVTEGSMNEAFATFPVITIPKQPASKGTMER
jgi:hypothetical protein